MSEKPNEAKRVRKMPDAKFRTNLRRIVSKKTRGAKCKKKKGAKGKKKRKGSGNKKGKGSEKPEAQRVKTS